MECACRDVPKLTENVKFQAIQTTGLGYKVIAVPTRIMTAVLTLGTSEEAMQCGDGKLKVLFVGLLSINIYNPPSIPANPSPTLNFIYTKYINKCKKFLLFHLLGNSKANSVRELENFN